MMQMQPRMQQHFGRFVLISVPSRRRESAKRKEGIKMHKAQREKRRGSKCHCRGRETIVKSFVRQPEQIVDEMRIIIRDGKDCLSEANY